MIAPIETYYAGYRFRSRLEARWAIFFKKAGIRFEYEPEGFNLKAKGYYLPDFYLPEFRAYVEIKPQSINEVDEITALCKLEDLFYESISDDPSLNEDGIVCIYCKGDPVDCTPLIYCNETDDSGGSTTWWGARFFKGAEYYDKDYGECESAKNKVIIAVGEKPDGRYLGFSDHEFSDCNYKDCNLLHSFNIIGCRDDLEDAKLAARQARFEHGERG